MKRQDTRAGQAYVETAIAVLLISFIFLGLFQLAQAFAAREILYHAAHRAARARTVGFNGWMVEKAMRVAAIPNAGAMLTPEWEPTSPTPMQQAVADQPPGSVWDFALTAWPVSEQAQLERARIPFYMASEHSSQAAHILDYEDWQTLSFEHLGGSAPPGGGTVPYTFETRVRQRFPLRIAMHRAFYAPPPDSDGVDRLTLSGRVRIENHYPLYLDDQNW